MTTFKPLLAASPLPGVSEGQGMGKLRFPFLWSPKLDGIRTLMHEGGPVSRKIKPIPNEKLRSFLDVPELKGFDGEMVYGSVTDKDVFNRTQSAVMTMAGPSPQEAEGRYLVFDDFTHADNPFSVRFERLTERVMALSEEYQAIVKVVPHKPVVNLDDLNNIEPLVIEKGYEGVMLRDPNGRYKYGRSTINEQILIKMKRFIDAEASIVGFEEKYRNDNELERDALGHAKRSTHQDNLVPMDTLGSIWVETPEWGRFKIGAGNTNAAQKQEMWNNRESYIGKLASFKYQPSGMKDVPRFGQFKGIRRD